MKSTPRASSFPRLIVTGVPLLVGATELYHPVIFGMTGVYAAVQPKVAIWIGVHIVQLLLLGPLALAVYFLTRGLSGLAVTVSRVALLFYLPLYSAWDAIAGIGTGVLVLYASTLPAEGRGPMEQAIDAYWQSPIGGNGSAIGLAGALCWGVAMIAAAVALRRAGAGALAFTLLIGAGLLFTISHVVPFGPAAMVCLLFGGWSVEQRRLQGTLRTG